MSGTVCYKTLLRVTGTKEAFVDSSTEFAFADPAVFQVLDAKYNIFVAGVERSRTNGSTYSA